MTREDAIEILRKLPIGLMDLTNEQKWDLTESVDLALAALRPVSWERVEKVWRGEWDYPTCEWNLPKCPKCGCNSKDATYGHKNNFCPRCGAAMTDEAVDIVMERLEALKDE